MSYKSKIVSAIKRNEIIHKQFKKSLLDDKAIKIVEAFITDNNLICYGGTAINAILSNKKKIYDYNIDTPDYDCFSPNAIKHATELSKIFANNGYENVEAKSALFKGTYKIFINFIPVADISQLEEPVYNQMKDKAFLINNIYYAPSNYLKLSLYQELSRPLGDISRWEKIYNRLTLLKEHLNETKIHKLNLHPIPRTFENLYIFNILKKISIENKFVLFGDFGLSFYKDYFPKNISKKIKNTKIKQIYILAENINDVTDNFKDFEYSTILYKKTAKFTNDIYKITINSEAFLYVFITNSCQSFNIINKNDNVYNIASIDTILSIYYSLEYVNVVGIDFDIIKVYCILLENIHSNNKTNILKRFYVPCVGKQETVEDIKKYRNRIYKNYKTNKKHKKYQELFFKYYPKTQKKIL